MDLTPSKMPFKALKCTFIAALCTGTVLGSASSLPAAAATSGPNAFAAAPSVYAPPSVGKVALRSASSIELKDVHLHGGAVRFSVTVTNGGSTELNFIDYWVNLRDTSGSKFTVHLIDEDPADKTGNRIAPKSAETYTFYATVGDNTRLPDLIFEFIQWNFDLESFEQSLGKLTVPASYQPVSPSGAVRAMTIADVSASTSIKRVNTAKTDDEFAVSLTFVFENTGMKSFTIPQYEFSIVTKEGLSYPLDVTGLSENESLHPRFKKEVILKGELPASVSQEGWRLALLEKQGESPALPVAFYELGGSSGSDVINAVPVHGSKEIIVSDEKVLASVASTVRNENDKNFLAAVKFSFINQGRKSIVVPDYLFKIRTSGGLTYPMTVSVENLRLDPLAEEEMELKAAIPLSALGEGWTLLMEEAVDDSQTEGDAVAAFALPDDEAIGLNQGASYDYSNDDGTYTITFDSVRRLPWEDQDILSAEFTVKNNGLDALPVPEFAGHFELDDTIEVNGSMVNKDSLIAIQPGSSIHMVLTGKIPYTYEYDRLTLALEEQFDDDTTADVVEFATNSAIASFPLIDAGMTHRITGAGPATSESI